MSSNAKPLALVTGGSKRVGKAVVQHLSHSGFDVLFTFNRSQADARALETRTGATAIACDLSQPTTATESILNAVNRVGQTLSVLVHNASTWEETSFGKITQSQIEQTLAVHVTSPLLITQALAGHLIQARGHVVMMLDEMIDRGWPSHMPYLAAKSALASLVKSLARQLAPHVTVNGISPGVVDWPDDTPESFKTQYLSRVPLARAGSPQDVARLVHFLATNGSYITGHIIPLDGGRNVT
jgi:pteridine reductase